MDTGDKCWTRGITHTSSGCDMGAMNAETGVTNASNKCYMGAMNVVCLWLPPKWVQQMHVMNVIAQQMQLWSNKCSIGWVQFVPLGVACGWLKYKMVVRGVLGRAHNLLEELLVIMFGISGDQLFKQIWEFMRHGGCEGRDGWAGNLKIILNMYWI